MKCTAISNKGRFELRTPTTEPEWDSYHRIKERGLWDNRVSNAFGPYDRDHVNHTPETSLILLRNGIVIGVLSLQETGEHGMGPEIEVRGVAIDPACQGQGYGGIMLMMAESIAAQKGFKRAGVWSSEDATLFYARNGYIYRPENMPPRLECPVPGCIAMTKRLDLGVAQNDGSVLIAAA